MPIYWQQRFSSSLGLIALVLQSSCMTPLPKPPGPSNMMPPITNDQIPEILVEESFAAPAKPISLAFLQNHPHADPEQLLQQAQQSWLYAEDILKKSGKWYPRLQALEESVIYIEQALLRRANLADCKQHMDCLTENDLIPLRSMLPTYAVTLLSFATARGLDTFFVYKPRLEQVATLLQQSTIPMEQAYSAYIRGSLLSQLPAPLGGDVNKAKILFQQAIQLQPENPLFHLALAEQLALQTNDMELFVTSLQQASQLSVTWQQGIPGQKDVIASKSAYLLAHVQDFF